jgi:phage-related protein
MIGLVVEILGDASKLANTLDDTKGKAGGWASSISGSAVKVAAIAGVAGIAAGAIIEMTAAAAADRDEQAKLEQAIAAAGAATATSTAQVEAAIAAGQERAFTDSETRDALQSLVTATGDVGLATEELTKAQDIARLAGVDLAVAADAVAKAHAGQDGPLRKLIPGLEKGATATDTLANATAKAAGQADLYAESSEGMQKRAGDSLGELSETIGEVFLPILDAIIPALLPILKAFGELVKALLPALIPLVKLLAGALGIAANVLSTVVGWLVKLVSWVGDAIGAVGRFLDSLNPLSNISLPSLPFLSASSSSAGGAGVGRSAGTRAAVPVAGATINVYTTGDGIETEQAIARALRRVARLNGGVIPAAPGWAIG